MSGMTAGSVTVADNGTITKAGMAGYLFDGQLAARTDIPDLDHPPSDWTDTKDDWIAAATSTRIAMLKQIAAECTGYAAGMVAGIRAMAEVQCVVKADATGDGLQVLPVTITAGTATVHPSVDKTIKGTIL